MQSSLNLADATFSNRHQMTTRLPRWVPSRDYQNIQEGDLVYDWTAKISKSAYIAGYHAGDLAYAEMKSLVRSIWCLVVSSRVTLQYNVDERFSDWIEKANYHAVHLVFKLSLNNPTVLGGGLKFPSADACVFYHPATKRFMVQERTIPQDDEGTCHLMVCETFDHSVTISDVYEVFAKRAVVQSEIMLSIVRRRKEAPDIPEKLEPGWAVRVAANGQTALCLRGPLATREEQLSKLATWMFDEYELTLPPPDQTFLTLDDDYPWMRDAIERSAYAHDHLRDRVVVMFGVTPHLPPYVVMWILDWLARCNVLSERRKIRCIESTYQSLRNVLAKRIK